MRAAIYARVSTRDKGQETENQLIQLRDFARSQNWAIFHEYIDHESGATRERPALSEMWTAASRRRFDVLLFWSLDRLTRGGALETLSDLNRLAGYGIQFRSYTEAYIDSCGVFGEAVIAILACIAKQERQRISERTRAGMERARKEGKRIGRPQADADRIRQLAAAGQTPGAIAAELGLHRSTIWRTLRSAP